jgi:hypothetical protein
MIALTILFPDVALAMDEYYQESLSKPSPTHLEHLSQAMKENKIMGLWNTNTSEVQRNQRVTVK